MNSTLAPLAAVVTETTWVRAARKHQPETTYTSRTAHVSNDCPSIVDGTIVAVDVPLDSVDAGLACDYCAVADRPTVDRYPGENDIERPQHGNGSGRRAARSTERTNRYAGRCAKCGGDVAAEAGLLLGSAGAWRIEHRDGDCVAAAAPAADAPAARTNRYAGRCARCGETVAENAGLLLGSKGAWRTEHVAGECPVAPTAAPVSDEPAPEGMHRLDDGRIFKVQIAHHGSGAPYAKLLVVHEDGSAEFVYAQGAVRMLSTETLMSLDEARSFGALYGVCCVCAATLTDEDSIRLGIGPVCGQRVAEWSTGTVLTKAQMVMLGKLSDGPQPIGRQRKTANALVAAGLARFDGDTLVGI